MICSIIFGAKSKKLAKILSRKPIFAEIIVQYPKISIITPSYNQGKFIEETILSVINQNYPNLEYIIIDGGSTDNSIEIIKRYKEKIHYWVSEKDMGQSDAINKGFKIATGEIITWLNSDDILSKNSLINIAAIFQDMPEDVGLTYGGVVLFGMNKTEIAYGYNQPSIERFLAGMAFPQPGTFFKKKFLDQIGLLNINYHYGMDYDLFSRMCLVCKFYKTENIFASYRLHTKGKSIYYNNLIIEEWIEIFLRRCKELKLFKVVEQLKKMKEFNEYFTEVSLNSLPYNNIIVSIDQYKLLFYFLCYVLKGWYSSGKIYEAKKVLNYLKNNFPLEIISEEKDVSIIQKRLKKIPLFILLITKKLQKLIR